MKRFTPVLAVLLLTVSAADAQKQPKPKDIKPSRWNLFSPDQDAQLGKEAAAEIEKQVAVVNNEQVFQYVNRIATRLTAQSEAGKYPYTFKVVYDNSINAFALPGGPSYVHTGLISAAENEAQIAGVLAHEISHVALRHGTSQVSKANAAQILAGIGGAVLGGGMLGQLAQMGAGLGANSLLLKFSRDAESDADLLGSRMMAKAGYDPVEMARFFAKLEEQEKSSGRSTPQFLSDHPSPGNRVKAVQAEVKMMPSGRSYSKGDTAELDQVKKAIAGLPVPPKANTNFRAEDPTKARPNGRMKQYRSGGLAFAYPENWQVVPDQQGSSLSVISQEGMAQVDGKTEIAYGAVIGLQPVQGQVNLDRDTQKYVQGLMQGNQATLGNEGTQRLQLSGAPALLHVLYSKSAFPNQKEIDVVITAQHPQGLFYVVLIAPEVEYQTAKPTFDAMVQSIQFTQQ